MLGLPLCLGLLVGCDPNGGSNTVPDAGAPETPCSLPGRQCQIQALAMGQQGPLGIAVAGGQAYWTSTEGRRVSRVAASGGLVAIVAHTAERPFTLTADGTHLYWIAHASTEGGLWRAPLMGGEPELLRALPYTLSNRVRVSGSHVYWLDGGSISRAPTQGGASELLVSGVSPVDFAADAEGIYFSVPPRLSRMTPGQSPVPLTQVPEGFDVVSLATDADAVYAALRASQSGGPGCVTTRVVRIPKAGGEPQTLGEHPEFCAMEVAVDATHVYSVGFTQPGLSSILRLPKGGGAPEGVIEGIPYSTRFALDASHVYWTENTTGRVARIPKP